MAIEEENYADVIDAFERDNMGYKNITDYIKGQNIKIKNIEMDNTDDESGIRSLEEAQMMMASDPNNDKLLERLYEEFLDMGMLPAEAERAARQRMMDMASETPEEEFEMMMDMEIREEFDEFKKNNPGKTFDDFMDIKFMRMARGGLSKEELMKMIEQFNRYGKEEFSKYQTIRSGSNRPRDPKRIIKPKLKLKDGSKPKSMEEMASRSNPGDSEMYESEIMEAKARMRDEEKTPKSKKKEKPFDPDLEKIKKLIDKRKEKETGGLASII